MTNQETALAWADRAVNGPINPVELDNFIESADRESLKVMVQEIRTQYYRLGLERDRVSIALLRLKVEATHTGFMQEMP